MFRLNEGFIPKLRAASSEKLRKRRGMSVLNARILAAVALVFFVSAVIAGLAGDRNGLIVASAIAVLQVVAMVSIQTRVWFIDLVLGEKTDANDS